MIVGQAEAAAGTAAVKALRSGGPAAFAEQRIVPLAQLPDTLVDALTAVGNT